MFYGHFCAHGRLNGNEAKSKMKHPSNMPTPRFELGCIHTRKDAKENDQVWILCGMIFSSH